VFKAFVDLRLDENIKNATPVVLVFSMAGTLVAQKITIVLVAAFNFYHRFNSNPLVPVESIALAFWLTQ
jgi:hypothetical protein